MEIRFKFWQNEGGWVQLALTAAGLLGGLMSRGAKASADNRAAEGVANIQRDRTASDNYQTQQDAQFKNANTDLARREFEQQSRPANAQQVALGDLLKNVQDVNISAPAGVHMGSVSGGLRPSVFGANTRAAGGELSRQALEKLLAGEHFDPVSMIAPPQATPTPQAGKLEKLLGILGTAGGLAGGVAEVNNLRRGGAPAAAPQPQAVNYNPDIYKSVRF